jgi:hypothetical protein
MLKRIWDEIRAIKARLNKLSTSGGQLRQSGGGSEFVGVLETHPHTGTGTGGKLSSIHTYVWVPDAEFNADVSTGGAQGIHHHSGPTAEICVKLIIEFETAPTGADVIIELEHGDTNDLDTVASWTRLVLGTLPASAKTVEITSFDVSTIPLDRLIRMNVDQVGSTVAGQNGSVHLEVRRPLDTG